MIGELYKENTPQSAYQPSKEIADFTAEVKKEYNYGYEILHRPWMELNNYSVVGRMNKDQRTFNSFVDESVDDPNEAWKWRGTRSMARNRTMAMHAHLTSNYVVPMIFAQEENKDDHKEMADTMRDILEWMTVNSNYKPSFLLATMGMLVNPVTYLGAEYCEVFQTIKERTTDGWTTNEILDEVLSGFQAKVYSADQVLITNAYEQNIQKQRSLIKRRYIEWSEAKAKWSEHENWGYVQSGIKSIYNDEDGLFYDVKDQDHPYLVEECTYLCRRTDTEVVFLNGIYMGDGSPEQGNAIKHRDNRNAPKYNVAAFGYERINEHFFFYKSLINRVGWDDKLLDAMYEVTMNREFLDLMPPIAISGEDKVDTQLVFPGATAAFANPDTKVNPIIPPRASGTGYQALQTIEASMSDASVSDVTAGQLPEANQKAYSVAQAQENAKILLSGAGKSLGESVTQLGQLMVDIALQHLTTAQVDEITGDIKYRSFILQDQMVNGKQVSKNILFDEAIIGRQMTKAERDAVDLHMLSTTGYPDHAQHLYVINPHLFSKMQYMCRVEPDMMQPKNEAFEKAVMSEVYTMFRQDPLINPEALVRRVAYAFFKGETDELIATQQAQQVMGQPQQQPSQQQQQPQMGAQATSSALSTQTNAMSML